MGFVCSSCNICCHGIKKIKEETYSSEPFWYQFLVVDRFTHKYDENGKCEKLVDGKCSVYEDRPLLCNIEELYNLYGNQFFEMGMARSKRGWFRLQALNCNNGIRAAGLDESFIVPTEY